MAQIRERQLEAYEAGRLRPRPRELVAIAEALDATIVEFFADALAESPELDPAYPAAIEDHNMIGPKALLAATCIALAASSASAAVKEIVIASSNNFLYLPLMVMKDQRLVERQLAAAGAGDVAVSYKFIGVGALVVDGVLAGQVQFAAVGVPPFLTLWDRTRDTLRVKALRAMSSAPFYLCTRNPKVRAVTDFTEADRINVHAPKATLEAIVLEMAAAQAFGLNHFDRLDALTVGLPAPDGATALISGELSADFTSPPFSYQELETPGVHLVTTSNDVLGEPATDVVLFSTTEFSEKNPKITASVTAALEEAIGLIEHDRRAAGDIYRRIAQPHWTRYADRMVEDRNISFGTNPHGMMKYAGFLHSVGRLETKPEQWRDFFTPEAAAALSGD